LEDSKGGDLYFSEFDDPTTKHGMAEGLDDDRSRRLAGKLIYRNLSAQVILADREKTIPTASYGTVFGDSRTATTDARSLIAINLDGTLARGPSYRLHLSRGQYRYEGAYPYEYGDASSSNVVLTDDGCDGIWYTGDALVSIPFDPHRLILGAEVRRSTRERQWYRDDQESFLDVDGQSTVWGTFAQAEAELGSRLRLVGGLRYDRDPSFGGTTNPRLAAIVQAPGHVRAKLLYGTAFRAPSPYERMYYTGQGPLGPETISTRELNLERPLSRRIDVRLSVFDNNTQNLIQLQSNDDGDLSFANAATYDAEGLELELRGAWPGGLRGSVRYSYVQVEDEISAEAPANSASRTAGVNVAVPIPASPLLVASELRYMGSRPAVDGSRVDAHFLTDLILSARVLHGRVDVTAGVRNLFDVEYADPGSEEHVQVEIGQDGRSFRATADIRF
jgi:iron complex outermembrane receptor protein